MLVFSRSVAKYNLCFDFKTSGRNRPLVIHATLIELNHDKSCALQCKSGLPERAVNFTTRLRSETQGNLYMC